MKCSTGNQDSEKKKEITKTITLNVISPPQISSDSDISKEQDQICIFKPEDLNICLGKTSEKELRSMFQVKGEGSSLFNFLKVLFIALPFDNEDLHKVKVARVAIDKCTHKVHGVTFFYKEELLERLKAKIKKNYALVQSDYLDLEDNIFLTPNKNILDVLLMEGESPMEDASMLIYMTKETFVDAINDQLAAKK